MAGRYVKKGCRTGPPGLESGFLKGLQFPALAGRHYKPIPSWFLDPIDRFKIPAQVFSWISPPSPARHILDSDSDTIFTNANEHPKI